MHGYPAESHYVSTSDGYIMTLHRIPKGREGEPNGNVVYLQHGLFFSSSQWVLTGPNKALGTQTNGCLTEYFIPGNFFLENVE